MRKKSGLMIIFIFASLLLVGCTIYSKEGVEYLKDKKYDKAIEAFNNAIDRGENVKDAYLGLAMSYYDKGEYDKALENFKTAKDKGAEVDANLAIYFADCYKRLGDEEKAIENFEAALTMKDITDKDRKEITRYLIFKYEAVGDMDKAKEKIKTYVKAFPDDEEIMKEAKLLEII